MYSLNKPLRFFTICMISIIILFEITVFISSKKTLVGQLSTSEYEKINKIGFKSQGKIVDIELFNSERDYPKRGIFSYEYFNNNEIAINNFAFIISEEIDLSKIEIGDSVNIKYLKDCSIVENFKPYRFPIHYLYLAPTPFILFLILFFVKRSVK
jgi:hypothetical protein